MAILVLGFAAAGSPGPVAGISIVGGVGVLGLGLTAGAAAQGLQRAANGAPFGGPSPFLVFAALALLSVCATFLVGGAFLIVGLVPDEQATVLTAVAINGLLAVGLVRLLVVGPGALTWRAMGFRRPAAGEGSIIEDVGWGMALAIPAFGAAVIIAVILTLVLGVTGEGVIPMTREPVGVTLNLLAAAFIAPLWEETFFRGFATTAWARGMTRSGAIVRGALFFALIHVLGITGSDLGTALKMVVIAFAIRIPVGLLLGWVLLRRRTIVAPIALHATYNAIPILLFLALGQQYGG